MLDTQIMHSTLDLVCLRVKKAYVCRDSERLSTLNWSERLFCSLPFVKFLTRVSLVIALESTSFAQTVFAILITCVLLSCEYRL